MIKELKYNGHTAVPSDYENADGDLATAINVVPEDGTLKAVLSPSEVLELADGQSVAYVHETAKFRHYIVVYEDEFTQKQIHWIENNGDKLTSDNKIGFTDDITKINAVGNTLLVFTKSSIIYYLWKDGGYSLLGDHLPNLEISFGLRGTPRLFSLEDDSHKKFNVTFDEVSYSELTGELNETVQNQITSQVMAKVNKFLSDQTIEKGRFALPFLVRYALRLFDGSLVCHSAPILMNPSTKAAPVVLWDKVTVDHKEKESSAECDIMLVSSVLDYRLVMDGQGDYWRIKDQWSDIVKSVDVFISKPIYTYDQNGKCKKFMDYDNFDTKFIGALDFEGYDKYIKSGHVILPIKLDGETYMDNNHPAGKDSTLGKKYVEWTYQRLYALFFSWQRSHPALTLQLAEYSDDKSAETIKNTSQFYLLKSLSLDELSYQTRQDIVVDDEYLQSLVAREAMTDDYLAHDQLSAEYSHTYNGRLNLSGVKRYPFRGFQADSMFAYCNSRPPKWTIEQMTSLGDISNMMMNIKYPLSGYAQLSVSVYIKENGENYVVSSNSAFNLCYYLSDTQYPTEDDAEHQTNGVLSKMSWGCYVYYPNTNAYRMVINSYDGLYDIELKAHEFLNGAFGLIDYDLQRVSNHATPPSAISNGIIDMPNKLYTSEINNPFYFPLLGINTVGTGNMLGLSTAAKALSEGQFGQFPMYAFTTDGVWALEVSSTGSYSAKQPITRDVCINSDSITQIDSSVLFATDRGIMQISGSQTQCISDSLNSPDPFSIDDLPKYEGLVSIYNDMATDNEKLKAADIDLLPFLDFIAGCRMVYDYTHQRIIVYNSKVRYSYVFSLDTKAWGMMLSDVYDNVNSYPEALAMSTKIKEDGTTVPVLVDFTKSKSKSSAALIVTRPFKFDDANMFKTIDTIIQRGYFKKNNLRQVLYGSNDLYNWHAVWSSKDKYMRGFHGTPYKAFRLGIACRLDEAENLFGCTVQFNPRRLNQPR